MSEYDIKRLALIFAVQAEIEGMKAANVEREAQGYALAYGEKAFAEAAEELKVLAYKHDEQL